MNFSNVPNLLVLIGTIIAGVDIFLPTEKIRKIDDKFVEWKERNFRLYLVKIFMKIGVFLFLLVLVLTFKFQDTVFLKLSSFLNISKFGIMLIIILFLLQESIRKRHFLYRAYQFGWNIGRGSNFGSQKQARITFLLIFVIGAFIAYLFTDFIINSMIYLSISYFYFTLTWYLLIGLAFLLTFLLTFIQIIIHRIFLTLNKSQKGFVRTVGYLILLSGGILQVVV